MSKKNEKRTLDLSKPIEDIKGNPIFESAQMYVLNQPSNVAIEGESFTDITRLIASEERLTYREAIQKALLYNYQQAPSIEKRTSLAFKITADTDVSFTSKEASLIIDCAKAYYSRQGQNPIVYLRILQLVDPEEAGKLTAA